MTGARRRSENTARPVLLKTRVTRTVHEAQLEPSAALMAVEMLVTAAEVRSPFDENAEAGRPPSVSAAATPGGGVTEAEVDGERVGERVVVAEADGSTAAAATESAPLSTSASTSATPDSFRRCVSVPSFSSVEMESSAAAEDSASRRRAEVSAEGSIFTERVTLTAPEASAAFVAVFFAAASTAAAAVSLPSSSRTLSSTAARKADCSSAMVSASAIAAGSSTLMLSSNMVCVMAEGAEDTEGLPLGVTPEGTGVPEGVRVPVGEAGVEGDSEG